MRLRAPVAGGVVRYQLLSAGFKNLLLTRVYCKFLDFPWSSHHTAAVRKRVRIAVAVLVVFLMGTVGWCLLPSPEREPIYQGRGLRAWLWEYYNGGNLVGVTNAVREMGTNAIPTLLRMLRKRDSFLA